MAKPVFNPDDFVFEKILKPEDNPCLIEWNAKNKLIFIRVKDPNTSEYDYEAAYLTEQVNANLLESIPDKWSNENDRIVMFAVYEDGTYQFTKEKLKYDFEKKKTNWVVYDYKNLSLDDVKEIFDLLKGIIWVQNAKNEAEKDEALLSLLRKDMYLDKLYTMKLHAIEQWLRETDWRVLPDAPQTFEGELDMWTTWRNYLRTSLKKREDFDDDIEYLIYSEEFKWPINPEMYHKIYPDHDVEYLSTEDQFTISDASLTDKKMELINEEIKTLVNKMKYEKENGKPITKHMWDIIQRYNITTGIEDLNLNVGEES